MTSTEIKNYIENTIYENSNREVSANGIQAALLMILNNVNVLQDNQMYLYNTEYPYNILNDKIIYIHPDKTYNKKLEIKTHEGELVLKALNEYDHKVIKSTNYIQGKCYGTSKIVIINSSNNDLTLKLEYQNNIKYLDGQEKIIRIGERYIFEFVGIGDNQFISTIKEL